VGFDGVLSSVGTRPATVSIVRLRKLSFELGSQRIPLPFQVHISVLRLRIGCIACARVSLRRELSTHCQPLFSIGAEKLAGDDGVAQ